jgi:orotidine 5'-phosphate decarboxylase subfamily 1
MLRYEQRLRLCCNPTAIKLLKIMAEKETNLAVSLDLVKKKDLLALADSVGEEICILKTHIDILEDFDRNTIEELTRLADKHRFIIFEDRKFADIGHTVKLQYEKGIFQIARWASITNAHPIVGPSIIDGLKEVGLPLNNALLLLAQMSSQGTLAKGHYTQESVKMALAHKDFVIGFITQRKLSDDPSFINLTPGVQLASKKDALGQQYITPWEAIYENESDIIIVGRGIYNAHDPKAAAKIYREQGWQAYNRLLSKPSCN